MTVGRSLPLRWAGMIPMTRACSAGRTRWPRRSCTLLEASTGKEQHTVIGLANASVADLNGDGVADLWGETSGELRAYRGEAPERWRALGHFEPAGAIGRSGGMIGSREVDFDLDGIADTLISELRAPGTQEQRTTGSQTAVARSGRDGHVIWKTSIDPRGSWFEPKSGDRYELSAFAPPVGDLDGDGVGDVIVRKRMGLQGFTRELDFVAAIEAISGRNGARLWSASVPTMDVRFVEETSDWLEPRVIEPNGSPDLIVRRDAANAGHLLRLSGRDGRIRWETRVSNEATSMLQAMRLRFFDDFDGDGALDVLVVVPHNTPEGQTEYTMMAVSLRDGKQLWSQPLRFLDRVMMLGDLRVADLDGDKRPEVIALEGFGEDGKNELSVRRFSTGATGRFAGRGNRVSCRTTPRPDSRSCWRISMGMKSGKCA